MSRLATKVALRQPALVERADAWLASLVGHTMEKLTYSDGELTESPTLVFDYLVWLARRSYDSGRTAAMLELLTATEVADQLGIDRTTVFRRAVKLGVGWHIGRDYLFWPEHVERIRKP